jgi:hypothetical protein
MQNKYLRKNQKGIITGNTSGHFFDVGDVVVIDEFQKETAVNHKEGYRAHRTETPETRWIVDAEDIIPFPKRKMDQIMEFLNKSLSHFEEKSEPSAIAYEQFTSYKKHLPVSYGYFNSVYQKVKQAILDALQESIDMLNDTGAEDQFVGIIKAVGKYNCNETFNMNKERIDYFAGRIVERRKTEDNQYVIIILNVDDPNGEAITNVLMPGYDWDQFRDKGEIPYARGLASRYYIDQVLKDLDPEAYQKLQKLEPTATPVVIVDHGVAEIF